MTGDHFDNARAHGVARAFHGKAIAFVAVMHDHESPDGRTRAALGVAVANERGFNPIPQFYFAADRHEDADAKADALNRDVLGLDRESVIGIQISTMGGRPYFAPEPEPVAQGPESNGNDLPTCRACGFPGSDDHESCPNCAPGGCAA